MKKNTPQLWNQLWKKPVTVEEDIYNLAREEKGVRWQRILKIISTYHNSITGLKVIEVGAGAGTNAALMAKLGAKVTIFDYSDKALARAKEFFQRNHLTASFVKGDALKIPKKYLGKYDIAMSFGLTEHFLGEKRQQINKAHWDLVKKGGLAFISVPNKYNPPYRLFKFLAERMGFWKVGEEYPYSRSELKKLCKEIDSKNYGFFGDSLIWSLNFINPVVIIPKLLGLTSRPNLRDIPQEIATPLDEYFSYALVLWARKDWALPKLDFGSNSGIFEQSNPKYNGL